MPLFRRSDPANKLAPCLNPGEELVTVLTMYWIPDAAGKSVPAFVGLTDRRLIVAEKLKPGGRHTLTLDLGQVVEIAGTTGRRPTLTLHTVGGLTVRFELVRRNADQAIRAAVAAART